MDETFTAGRAEHRGGAPERDAAVGVREMATWLVGVRSAMRRALVVERAGWILTGLVGALLVVGLLDAGLRLSTTVRVIAWLIGAGALVWAVRRYVLPAMRFRPGLTEVALRVERSGAGASAGLGGVLASGLELGEAGAGHHGEDTELKMRVASDAYKRSQPVIARGPWCVVSRTNAARATGGAGGAVLVTMLVLLLSGQMGLIGVSRVLWPWGGAAWPKLTEIADATDRSAHPAGSALALRGVVVRSKGEPADARVRAWYTFGGGEPRSVLLTSQERRVEVERTNEAGETVVGEGALFERLIDPGALMLDEGVDEARLVYWLESGDDRTPSSEVLVVRPPEVVAGEVSLEPPAYAQEAGVGATIIDVGDGGDERGWVRGVLAGTRATLTVRFNKPVVVPGVRGGSVESARSAGEVLGADARRMVESQQGRVRAGGDTVEFFWEVQEGSATFEVSARDKHGVSGGGRSVFRVEGVADRGPTVSVLEPAEDRSMLLTAAVDIVGEARDDVGVASARLERVIVKGVEGSASASVEGPTEATGEPVEFAREDAVVDRRIVVEGTVDLAILGDEEGLEVGDEVWVWAVARDGFVLGDDRHDEVRSRVRKIRVMSRDDLIGQVWDALGDVRRNAIGLEASQRGLAEELARSETPGRLSEVERDQQGVSRGVGRERERVEQVADRVEENGLRDESIERALREARRGLARAEELSADARRGVEGAREAAEAGMEGQQRTRREQAAGAQEGVREALDDVISVLDQGEDTWAVRREIESLLERQRALEGRTAQAEREMVGRDVEELSEGEREELAGIASEQEALADRASALIEELQERAEQMREDDPAVAQALEEASRRGRREQVSERMERAGEQARENRTSSARGQQQQAAGSLEQMLEDVEDAERNRDAVLRRYLASIISSLERLVEVQEDELAALEQVLDTGGDGAGLDGAMVRLHRETVALLGELMEGPRELGAVAGFVESASVSQMDAVVALRQGGEELELARDLELMSLESLEEALLLAREMDEQAAQRERDRVRKELRESYQGALEEQEQLIGASEPMFGEALSRRERAVARGIGREQEGLRERVRAIRENAQGLSDVSVFVYAHERIDDLMQDAAGGLSDGRVDGSVLRSQRSAARVLRSLVEALDEEDQERQFRQAEGGQGGGGGGGSGGEQPLVPPAAEVKVLRGMQEEVLDMTRVAEGIEDGVAEGRELVEQAGLLQAELAEQGRVLLERLQQQQQQNMPGGGGGGGGGGGDDEGGV